MKRIYILFLATLFVAITKADIPTGYAIYGDVPSGYTDLTSNINIGDFGGGYNSSQTSYIEYTGKGLGGNVGEGNCLTLSFIAAQTLQLTPTYKVHIVMSKAADSENNVQFSLCRGGWNENRAGKTITAASLSTDDQDMVLANTDLTESNWGTIRTGDETVFEAGDVMRFCAVNGEVIQIKQIYIENVFTPFVQSANLGILRVKNLPLYDHANSHLPNISNGVKESIDFYVVSIGQDTYYRQVARTGSFDGSNDYDNQLLTWKSDYSANKEIYRSFKSNTETYSDYFLGDKSGLWGIGDNVACYVSACAKMWGHGHLYSEQIPFRGTYVCTPTGDRTAPTAVATANYDTEEGTCTIRITASDNSGEIFYYVVNETKSTKQISFVPTFVAGGASEGDIITCYAVDFDGNMSAPFRVAAMTCDNCFLVQ